MVLLPFNFWIAAELVVFIGMLTMAWELHRWKSINGPNKKARVALGWSFRQKAGI
jgi:hypothetical protein